MDKEKKKCEKYEGLFIFQDEKSLLEHIKECEDCRIEDEKYKKISSMVKEVAPIYLEREKTKNMMRAAKRLACCFIAFVGLSVFTGVKMYDDNTGQIVLEQDSYVSEMGLPVDDYGFLEI